MAAGPEFTAPGVGQGGSPKGQYTYFLLQQCARHQWIMSSEDQNVHNIERSCLSLISWCPDRATRTQLHKLYYETKNKLMNDPADPLGAEASIVSASIFVVGTFVDYLNEALEFTEESYGVII